MTPASRRREAAVRKIIEAFGNVTRTLGFGRAVGQIFAFLYFSPVPRSLDDLTAALGISKGSASIGVRQLQSWEAIEKVWIKGQRKDYYAAHDRLGLLLKSAMASQITERMTRSAQLLAEAEHTLGQARSDEERYVLKQVTHLRAVQQKGQALWDLAASLITREQATEFE